MTSPAIFEGQVVGMTEGQVVGMIEGQVVGMIEGQVVGMIEGQVVGMIDHLQTRRSLTFANNFSLVSGWRGTPVWTSDWIVDGCQRWRGFQPL
jgi:hypothetical protein